MTEKRFEYQDAQHWYVAKISSKHQVVTGSENLSLDVTGVLDRLLGDTVGIELHLLEHGSEAGLLSFLAQVASQLTGKNFQLRKHQGALLLVEDQRLVWVSLPKEGVKLSDFLGQGEKEVFETILIATKNEGKTREFRAFFEKLGYQVENLNQYPDLADVEETGTTFEENARLKAETIARETGKMVLADDSGLKVDVLGGLPGVWSARFSGPGATDERNNAKLLHELAMVFDQKDRSAQFHCTLVVAAPGRDSLVVEADWPGYIAMEPKGEHGFGYDPLFLVGESGRTAAELSLEEKNQQSHRALALQQLLEVFPGWQKQL